MFDFFMGIDPGRTGAFAITDKNGDLSYYPFKKDIYYNALRDALERYQGRLIVCVENVHAHQLGGNSSSFTFGRNLGHVEGILKCYGFIKENNWFVVLPVEWQRKVTSPIIKLELKGLSKEDKDKLKKEHKKNIKLESIRAAKEAFDIEESLSDGEADAINIARYAKLMYG